MISFWDGSVNSSSQEPKAFLTQKLKEGDIASLVVNYDEMYLYINDKCMGLMFKDKEIIAQGGEVVPFIFFKVSGMQLATVTGGTNKLFEPTAKLANK